MKLPLHEFQAFIFCFHLPYCTLEKHEKNQSVKTASEKLILFMYFRGELQKKRRLLLFGVILQCQLA